MASSIALTWAPSLHGPRVLYTVQFRQAGALKWINATPQPLAGTTCVVTGLVDNALYEFRRLVSNGLLWIETSETTQYRAGCPPTPPANLTVTQL